MALPLYTPQYSLCRELYMPGDGLEVMEVIYVF
jgi:hypothetical protein